MNRSLSSTYNRFVERTRWIESFVQRGRVFDATSQHLVGELAILYLAISLEQTLEEICLNICCGASYLDGQHPKLVAQCKSKEHALSQLRTFGRSANKRLYHLKWLNAVEIEKNIKFVVDSADPIFNRLLIHKNNLDLIRVVRNHVAHRSKSSISQYRNEVRQLYGPLAKALAPGAFLMSERRSIPSRINSSIIEARVFVKDVVRI